MLLILNRTTNFIKWIICAKFHFNRINHCLMIDIQLFISNLLLLVADISTLVWYLSLCLELNISDNTSIFFADVTYHIGLRGRQIWFRNVDIVLILFSYIKGYSYTEHLIWISINFFVNKILFRLRMLFSLKCTTDARLYAFAFTLLPSAVKIKKNDYKMNSYKELVQNTDQNYFDHCSPHFSSRNVHLQQNLLYRT